MKKTICIILLLVLLTLLASCAKGDSTYRQTIEVAYQDSFAIEQAPFEGKTNIVWETKDESIAVFEDGKINGLLPGETDITALENGNVIAVYTVKVTTTPPRTEERVFFLYILSAASQTPDGAKECQTGHRQARPCI